MPLQRRVPKFGFKNPFRVSYKAINLDDISRVAEATKATVINAEVLVESGLASKRDLIKVLGRGVLTIKLEVIANGFSKSAVEAIEKAGGKAVTV
jgi:large subunit ribosomal protein L15